MTSLAECAHALAARGLRVFPLTPGTKNAPAITDWPNKATADLEKVDRVWKLGAYNIAVVCGRGILGIDVDVKNGKCGFDSLMALNLPPEALDTFTVRTPSGGLHLYYATDKDVGNSAGTRLGDGIDVRGAAGYLVGPGSVIDGRAYEIVNDVPIRPAPAAILDRLDAPIDRTTTLPLVDLDQQSAIDRGVDYLRGTAPAVEGQGGDEITFRTAARLKDFGLSEVSAYELMLEHWNERCEPPWPAEDLETKVQNAYRYGLKAPGADHPEISFRGVHVEAPVREPVKWIRHGDAWSADAAWLFYEILPTEGVAVIVGPPQAGKTFLVLELARCGATDKPFFGVKADEKFATLFAYSGTEGAGLPRRLAALGEEWPLPIAAMSIPPLTDQRSIETLCVDLMLEAANMQETRGRPVKMIVLETLAASGLLKDENDNADVSRALSTLAALGRKLGVLLIVSHHPPKDGRGIRGASAIAGAADVIIEIVREGQESLREVHLTKAREAEQRALGSFTLVPVELGKDSRGRPVKSLTVSMGEPLTTKQTEAKYGPLLMECIDFACVSDGLDIKAKRYAPKAAVWGYFNERCTTISARNHRNTAFNQALRALDEAGVLDVADHAGEKHYRAKEIAP